jgi:hypothetical protein
VEFYPVIGVELPVLGVVVVIFVIEPEVLLPDVILPDVLLSPDEEFVDEPDPAPDPD